MAVVSVDRIRPGMVLAEDVETEEGRLLLGKGTKLGEKHCRVLRIWGVFQVQVEGDDEPEEILSIDPESLRKAECVARECLRHANCMHPMVAELLRIRTVREARILAGWARSGQQERMETVLKPPSEEDLDSLTRKEDADLSRVLDSKDLTLAALPQVLDELLNIIRNPKSSALHIAQVVEKDTSLTARLLKIVNSPFYGFPSKIDTISRAIAMVGTQQLTTLAMGVTAVSHFRGIAPRELDMRLFWRESLKRGFCARILAAYAGPTGSERFFVGGLLLHIGRLVLFQAYPEEEALAHVTAFATAEPLHKVERKLYGFDHADAGGALLSRWKLPETLAGAVKYQYRPTAGPSPVDAAVAHVTDVMVAATEAGSRTAVPPLDILAWERLNLPVSALEPIVNQIETLYDQTAGHFLGAS